MTRKTASNESDSSSLLGFLAGGGEMGAHMRALDWTQTPLGKPQRWPQSLRTTVSLMLSSRYPMFIAWGKELAFLYNDGYQPILGSKHPAALGQPFAHIWAEIWEDIRPLVERALSGEATWSEDLQLFIHRRGYPEEVYFTFSYSPVRDESGDIGGMFCACTETTERVLGERRLRVLRDLASRSMGTGTAKQVCRRISDVLERAPLDLPFSALYLVSEQTGAGAQLMCATRLLPAQVAPPRIDLGDSAALWPVGETIRSGTPQLIEDVTTRVGSIPSVPWPESVQRALVLPLKVGGHPEPSGCLIVGLSTRREFDAGYRDFLELVAGQVAAALADAQAYEAERRRAEALAEIDRVKTAFFSNVSHEFRTPLTLMLGPVEETLADADVSQRTRERLDLVNRNAQRLLRLVNSLLDFSRIEAGRMQASYEPVDLAALTRDLASTFRSAIEQAGMSFEVECDALDETVYVDREMWEKIVLNLLSNAFKFTREGRIVVRVHRSNGQALLEVRDTGVGVPPQELPRLFERFYRVEGALGRTHEGSGIGLALVQELVKLHGGAIEAQSTLGQGTTFTVSVPLGHAHLPKDHLHAPRERSSPGIGAQAFVQEALRWLPDTTPLASGARAEGEPSALDRRFASTFGSRILLADDNADMRAYVRGLLAPFYPVETVADGEAALALIRHERPALVISDVMMPRLDGFGLLKALRADRALQSVPVIMLSARAGEEARIAGLDAGADDYLTKPFSARELLARVGALLERTLSDRRKDEFLAILAHELRGPLAPLRNGLQIARLTGKTDSPLQRTFEMMDRQLNHLVRLVDDLLDMSRISSGKIELRRQKVALGDVLASSAEASRSLIEAHGHELIVDAEADDLVVEGDFDRLVQIFSNLLSNSAKYTERGGRIRISLARNQHEAVVRVSDTGIGIPEEYLERVFDMFSQVRLHQQRAEGGLGIGLSIVRTLVSLHGGSINAYSAGSGTGSTFTVRFPLAQGISATEKDRGLEAPKRAAAPRRRILIADDNEDTATSLALLLQLQGHVVTTTHDGLQAVAQVQALRPEIVFLDLGMPKLDGLEAARRIRALPDAEGIVLVAVTGWGNETDRQRTREAGFDLHLVKPVTTELLGAALAARRPVGEQAQ